MSIIPLFKMGDNCPKNGCAKPITSIYFIHSLRIERYVCEENHHTVFIRMVKQPEAELSESYPFLLRDKFGKEKYNRFE